MGKSGSLGPYEGCDVRAIPYNTSALTTLQQVVNRYSSNCPTTGQQQVALPQPCADTALSRSTGPGPWCWWRPLLLWGHRGGQTSGPGSFWRPSWPRGVAPMARCYLQGVGVGVLASFHDAQQAGAAARHTVPLPDLEDKLICGRKKKIIFLGFSETIRA